MATLTVGSDQQYTTIQAAVAASSSGDTINVEAGTYTNDFVTITHNLSLNAVGGTVTMVATEQPPNGKAIIDEGGSGVSVSITGFDISGATVPDGNGAAIRYEGGSLTLSGDTVHNNQEGILAAADPNGTIVIDKSTFSNNGAGDGSTHNIYVGAISSLTVENSTITSAQVGHDIKSRAATTTITGNTITDGSTGTASYEIDLPNGGAATITGNVIEKGTHAQNPIAISYGEEGNLYGNGSLSVTNNTILNDDTGATTTAVVNDSATTATISGNSLYGFSNVSSGPATLSNNTQLTTEPALSGLSPTSTSTGTTSTGTTSTGTTSTGTTSTGTTTTGTTSTGTTSSGTTSTGTTSSGSSAGTGAVTGHEHGPAAHGFGTGSTASGSGASLTGDGSSTHGSSAAASMTHHMAHPSTAGLFPTAS